MEMVFPMIAMSLVSRWAWRPTQIMMMTTFLMPMTSTLILHWEIDPILMAMALLIVAT